MTSATPPTPPRPGAPGSPATPPPPPPGGPTVPPTTGPGAGAGAAVPPVQGSTDVLPAVVQKVAAFAARELPGVVDLGGSTSRAVSSVRQTLTGSSDSTAGVRVEMEGETATLGLDVAIEYGAGARELVRSLRRHVPEAVAEIAGVTVTELNIVITDVRLPGGDES